MNKKGLKHELREKLLRDRPCLAPVDTSLSPLNSKSKLIKVIEQNKVAEIELTTKRILGRTPAAMIVGLWNDIASDRTHLRSLFIDCNDTINEHKASKFRFREKIRDNILDKSAVLDETRKVQLEVEDLKGVRAQMEHYVSEYSIYEDFLRYVAQTGPEFNSVGNVLNRYETLENTRRECAQRLEEELNEASQMRREMQQTLETKNTELKNLSNKLIMMQIRQKEAKEKRMYWENLLYRIKRVMAMQEEEKVCLGGGIWDLYRKMCARRKLPVVLDKSDLERQLEFIQSTMLFYKEVNTIASAHKP